ASACLSLPRVLALVGGLGLAAAFAMPWFSTQGLLLSGQFLHAFLSSPTDLRRFLPGSSGSPAEAQLLRALVDLFPVCGLIAAVAALVGGLISNGKRVTNVVLGLSGGVPFVAWAAGIGQLPPGASPEVGLWLIPGGALAILLGLALEQFRPGARQPGAADRLHTTVASRFDTDP
ncbi:MAG TPA: hypothetical protein VGQ62_00295, partial [Chloroflexota bacterium]|nr:hypothetical protein [Chloroflexota bacterium]